MLGEIKHNCLHLMYKLNQKYKDCGRKMFKTIKTLNCFNSVEEI